MLGDLTAFVHALFNKWSAILLGSSLALATTLWFGFGEKIPPLWYGVIIGVAFIWAVFLVWRDQFNELTTLSDLHRVLMRSSTEEHETLNGRLYAAHAKIAELEAKIAAQSERTVWRPVAELNSYLHNFEIVNELALRDGEMFEVESVVLLDAADVKMAQISLPLPEPSREHHIRISQQNSLELSNRNINVGKVKYTVRRGPFVYAGVLPFRIDVTTVTAHGTVTYWNKIIG